MACSHDSRGNITASFGADFFQQGATSIPNLLLKYYKRIGLNDIELVLLIHLLRFKCEENEPYPTTERLAKYMASDNLVIKGIIAALMEKNMLSLIHYYDENADEIFYAYSYDSLFERISEVWARDKMVELQKTKRAIRRNRESTVRETVDHTVEKDFAIIHKSFEKEFGRLLSPMEIEQIKAWLMEDQNPTDIIMEALRRAVMLGKHNFKYIDTILLEWKKNSLLTINDINTYESNFKQRQSGRQAKNTNPKLNPNPNSNSNSNSNSNMNPSAKIASKKEKIKLLYNL